MTGTADGVGVGMGGAAGRAAGRLFFSFSSRSAFSCSASDFLYFSNSLTFSCSTIDSSWPVLYWTLRRLVTEHALNFSSCG